MQNLHTLPKCQQEVTGGYFIVFTLYCEIAVESHWNCKWCWRIRCMVLTWGIFWTVAEMVMIMMLAEVLMMMLKTHPHAVLLLMSFIGSFPVCCVIFLNQPFHVTLGWCMFNLIGLPSHQLQSDCFRFQMWVPSYWIFSFFCSMFQMYVCVSSFVSCVWQARGWANFFMCGARHSSWTSMSRKWLVHCNLPIPWASLSSPSHLGQTEISVKLLGVTFMTIATSGVTVWSQDRKLLLLLLLLRI